MVLEVKGASVGCGCQHNQGRGGRANQGPVSQARSVDPLCQGKGQKVTKAWGRLSTGVGAGGSLPRSLPMGAPSYQAAGLGSLEVRKLAPGGGGGGAWWLSHLSI